MSRFYKGSLEQAVKSVCTEITFSQLAHNQKRRQNFCYFIHKNLGITFKPNIVNPALGLALKTNLE